MGEPARLTAQLESSDAKDTVVPVSSGKVTNSVVSAPVSMTVVTVIETSL